MRSTAINATTQPTFYVVATTLDGTRAALQSAIPLAKGAGARLIVLVPQVVPYPLSLDVPAESPAFGAGKYRELVEAMDADARVRLCLCRDRDDVVRRLLPAAATVVLGGRAGSWLASREERLARRLTHLGHHVVFAPIDEPKTAHRRTGSRYPQLVDARSPGRFRGAAAAVERSSSSSKRSRHA